MLDPKKLLDELLGSNVPGTQGTVRDKAGQAVDLAKKNPLAAGAIVVHDFDAALEIARARGEKEIFVVGGADVYALALPRADRLYLTRVDAVVEGDVRFPDFDESGRTFKLVEERRHAADARHEYAFTIQRWERC